MKREQVGSGSGSGRCVSTYSLTTGVVEIEPKRLGKLFTGCLVEGIGRVYSSDFVSDAKQQDSLLGQLEAGDKLPNRLFDLWLELAIPRGIEWRLYCHYA